ncbi:SoxR reducing system RseC family protein [Thiolapillus sp.]
MLEEQGIVLSVSGDTAEVVAETKSTCDACAVKNGCGTSLVASLFPQRQRTFRASNPVAAQVGDRVLIGLDESVLQTASLLVYIVPLLGLIGGAMAGTWLASPLMPEIAEAISIGAGIAGFTLALLVVRKTGFRLSAHGRYQAKVLRVLDPQTFSVESEKLLKIQLNEK